MANWGCRLVLYMVYYPPHLKYVETNIDTHDTRPPIHVKTPIKTDEWRLSITLSWVVVVHMYVIMPSLHWPKFK